MAVSINNEKPTLAQIDGWSGIGATLPPCSDLVRVSGRFCWPRLDENGLFNPIAVFILGAGVQPRFS
jgi:hypothetical protein